MAALVEAGVDVVIVDTAHGHHQGVIDKVASIKKRHGEVSVVGGNIGTAQAALDLAAAGADAVKVGIGPGSICTTRIVTGVGVPQISAVANVVDALKDTSVCVISDGGIRYSRRYRQSDCCRRQCCDGRQPAGRFRGSPGRSGVYQGRSYKSYRGMGSLGAMSHSQGSSDRYFQDGRAGQENWCRKGLREGFPTKVRWQPLCIS